ncbi:hypothetical protein [Streptomyces sp. NPDC001828]|uniref:hypothetical protein n=1 Tax=Streptomyces sp. NPDC001828 TaxID=3364615 RepID=UPI003673C685
MTRTSPPNSTAANPTTVLTQQTDTAQHLARSALAIAETLGHQPSMYHSPVIRAVFARVRQLAHLATDAADHLIDAVDILNDTRAGLPSSWATTSWPS